MNDGWSSIRLGDACVKVGSGATPRGGKEVYLEEGPVALIRSQNIYNDRFSRAGLAYITGEQASLLHNVTVEPCDVLLNITGDSVARCTQVEAQILPARVNQHVAIVRPDSAKLDARFLRYYLIAPQTQQRLLQLASAGATRPALTKAMIESLLMLAPVSVAEQQAIASILGALDDKIEINRKMSATLEAIARALFKSWFVGFDPVRAKSEGRDTGLPPKIAALFPDSLENSQLGEIPKGWRVLALDEIARFLNGLALQKYPPVNRRSVAVIKIAQLRAGNAIGADIANADLDRDYIVGDGDVLFSWSGSLECVLWTGGTGALNQHLFKVTSASFPKWFYFLWIHQHLDEFRHIAAGKATTMGHIQRHHLSDAKAVIPPANVLKNADSVLSPLLERLVAARLESRTLARIRDTLLPKLISGEIRVRDAEHFVEKSA